ncbi:hypothetical protein H6F95_03035 [Cyanobacteria bacterium FACHB-471]|nr:hypothetical protein [Cyanobacteria bacterium FACHB-471]
MSIFRVAVCPLVGNMNVNATDASSTQVTPRRTDWRNSLLWSSAVLASSFVLLLESSLAAAAQADISVGDRSAVPSRELEPVAEIDSEAIAWQEASIRVTAATSTQPSEEPQSSLQVIEAVTESVEASSAEVLSAEALHAESVSSTPLVDPLDEGQQIIGAEDEAGESSQSLSLAQSQLEAESGAVDASPTSLELSRLHTETIRHFSIEFIDAETDDAETGAKTSNVERTETESDYSEPEHTEPDPAEAIEFGEASAEEISETAATSLRIPSVIDSTANDWSQVLTALQTEFFTSDSETVSVSSSSNETGELTRILASLEAEFFNSESEPNTNIALDEPELAQVEEYQFTPEELLGSEAIAPGVTVRDPIVIALNSGVETIAWTGAEAEPGWQPLMWDCDTADCYELSEVDLASLPELQLVQTSSEVAEESTPDPILIGQAESEDEAATSGSALVLGAPYIQLQGAYVLQGDESSARARATVLYPSSPNLLFGATVDLAGGEAFGNADGFGLELNELYATFLPPGTSGLRFTAGLMDLTSYFDRNSFAKDVVTHFFNPVFQTNPALSAAGLSSRIGAMATWNPTDNVDVRATVFSSNRDLSEFALDAFAGEVGFRAGNLILRGTYISAEDPGSGDGFEEIFGIDRGDAFGVQEGDREEAFGLNAEYFIPGINLGLFARYGHYTNQDVDESANTYSFGINLLDLFMPDDRLGLAYGRGLSNDELRRDRDDESPDVLELFYDFRLSPNLRAGATIQQRNEFSETVFGFRVRADLDVTGLGRQF